MLKKLFVSLMAFGILFPADLGLHCLQVPVMFLHYHQHTQQEGPIGFLDFMDYHLSEEAHQDDSHDREEESFPCHHHQHFAQAAVILAVNGQEPLLPAFTGQQKTLSFAEPGLGSYTSALFMVWNPPKV